MRAFLLLVLLVPLTAKAGEVPPGFVYLRDIDASIAQDMRYASDDNFVGRPLPGYGAPECILRRDVAQALAKVQADLAPRRLSLKVYDCYRPRRAVAAMARWANDGARGEPTKRFFPALEKRTLFGQGYIASQSAHSTGSAVDLTLIALPAATQSPYDKAAPYGPCTGPAAQRAPDNSLDMGTGYDCFDGMSSTFASNITAEQNRARNALNDAMRKHGFKSYFREWWHFSFGKAGTGYDVPITGR